MVYILKSPTSAMLYVEIYAFSLSLYEKKAPVHKATHGSLKKKNIIPDHRTWSN